MLATAPTHHIRIRRGVIPVIATLTRMVLATAVLTGGHLILSREIYFRCLWLPMPVASVPVASVPVASVIAATTSCAHS